MGNSNSGPLTKEEKNLALQNVLDSQLPRRSLILNTLVGTIGCLFLIALQIFSIAKKGPLYYVATGIWVGAIVLLCKTTNIYLLKRPTVATFNIWFKAQLITSLALMANTIINTVAQSMAESEGTKNSFSWLLSAMLITGVALKVGSTIVFFKFKIRQTREQAVLEYRKSKGEQVLL